MNRLPVCRPGVELPPAPTSTESPRRPRNFTIDFLRILSASALFYWHVGIYTHWPGFRLGSWATGVFISTATFCAVRYSRDRAALLSGIPSHGFRFFRHRFWDLYPTYVFVTLLIFFGSFLHPATGHTHPFSVTDLALNLLMLSQYAGKDYFTAPMWFLPVILQVYLLIPLLVRFVNRPKTGLAGCALISTVACLAVHAAAPDRAVSICNTWSPIFRLTPVFLGLVLGLLPDRRALPGILLTVALCALARLALVPFFPNLEPTFARPAHFLFALGGLTGVALLLTRSASASPRFPRLITQLGRASFPFFLIHGVLIAFLWNHFGNSAALWGAYFVACWLVSLGFVAVATRVRAFIRTRKSPPATADLVVG